jgi:hypothetical protein
LKDGKVTTGGNLLGGESEEADYFFKIRKGKLVPGGNIITGFTNFIYKKCSNTYRFTVCIFSFSTNKRFWIYYS